MSSLLTLESAVRRAHLGAETSVSLHTTSHQTKRSTCCGSKCGIARDRERQPSTNQITSLTRATPAIYQSYLPGRRNHPAYIAHRTRTRTIKTPSTLQLMRRWTFDLDIELTHGQPASYWARPVNTDDGLEVIMWIRCLLFAQT